MAINSETHLLKLIATVLPVVLAVSLIAISVNESNSTSFVTEGSLPMLQIMLGFGGLAFVGGLIFRAKSLGSTEPRAKAGNTVISFAMFDASTMMLFAATFFTESDTTNHYLLGAAIVSFAMLLLVPLMPSSQEYINAGYKKVEDENGLQGWVKDSNA